MDQLLLNTSRNIFSNILEVTDEEKLLIVKTVSGKPILMKYIANKTPIKHIYDCLENKIKYSLNTGSNILNMDHFRLVYKNNPVIDEYYHQDISTIGLSGDCELVNLVLKTNHELVLGSDTALTIEKCNHRKQTVGNSLLFIKTNTGRTIELNVPNDVYIFEIKLLILEKVNIKPDQQRLIYGGRQLEDSRYFKEYCLEEIINNKVLHLVLRLYGGMYNCVSGRDGEYKPLDSILNQIWKIEPKE